MNGTGVFGKIFHKLKTHGIRGLFSAARQSLCLPRRLDSYRRHGAFFEGKVGLEIGGPSGIFSRGRSFPVYAVAERIDNCNFGRQTIGR